MARRTRAVLLIEGYEATVTRRETVLRALDRQHDQRDERAYEVALRIPADDLVRVAEFLIEAAHDAEEMVYGAAEECDG